MVTALKAQIGTVGPDPACWPSSRPTWLFYGSCPARPLLGSGGQGQRHRLAAKELTQELQGRTPLLPTRPPHRHQDRLRPRPRPGPATAPDLAQDDTEADRQLGPPVGRIQARLAQEREQV